ncbi:MAG: amidohydrolase family protein [Fimbriimonadaceae bacterium]|nr:amidohydrolase family protein [Fimbriimonadaceae bacterium]
MKGFLFSFGIPLLVGISSSSLAQGQAPASLPQDQLALIARRVEIGDGTSLAPGVVVISGGKIVSVSPGRSTPTGVPVLDLGDSVLTPGFIDGFTGRGLRSQPAAAEVARPNTGVDAPNTMWIANRKGISAEYLAKDQLQIPSDPATSLAGITTAVLCSSRGSIRGTAALVDLMPEAIENRVVLPNAGVAFSFRSIPGAGYPSNLLGVIALLRQVLTDATSLRDGVSLWEGAKPSWAATLEALQPVVKREAPVIFEANFAREIDRALDLSEEFQFKVIILGGRDSSAVVSRLSTAKVPLILSAAVGSPPSLTDPDGTPEQDRQPAAYRQERRDRWQEQATNASALAGKVPFCFSSEGAPQNFLAGIRERIRLGLAPEVALRSLTLDAAKIFGAEALLGSIQAGKKANLVVFSGSFDLSTSRVTHVWIDGRPVFRETTSPASAVVTRR